MYTMLDDQRQAKLIKAYMANHPKCTIKDIVQNCVVCRSRLKYLEQQGYFELPKLTIHNILDMRFKKNRQYTSVTVGREYGKWTGY